MKIKHSLTIIPILNFLLSSCGSSSASYNLTTTASSMEASVAPTPKPAPNPVSNRKPYVSDDGKKYVAITFDDGPHPLYTPILLDELKARGIHATFFVVGDKINTQTAKDIVKRAYDEGHVIGNHTVNHKILTKISNSDMIKEIKDDNKIIEDITGKKTTLFRPPYGLKNNDVIAECLKDDMAIVLWNVDPRDWEYKDADVVYNNIINQTKPGSIILVHDIYITSIEGAVRAIDELTKKGYTFITADELINRYQGLESGQIYTY